MPPAIILLGLFIAFSWTGPASAADFPAIKFSALESKARLILFGQVEDLMKHDAESDIVDVKVGTVLKGRTPAKTFTLHLRNRGMIDFDPQLKVGDQGLFFLESIGNGKGKLAYWGSVAMFPKLYFEKETPAADSGGEIRVQGTLQTGVVAIGGETTGVVLNMDDKKTWELDLGKDKKLQEAAKKLDGKKVVVTGTYRKVKGVEIAERHIVRVKTLKPK